MSARCVLVAGPGGTGCSTYAAALAHGYADSGRSVLLLGTDPFDDATALVQVRDGGSLRLVSGRESDRTTDQVLGPLLDMVGLDPRLSREVGLLREAAAARLLRDLGAARLEAPESLDKDPGEVIVIDAGSWAVDLVRLAGAAPWMLQRVAPAQRGWLATSRPLLAAALGSRWPGDALTEHVQDGLLHAAAAREALLGAGSAVVVCAGSAPDAKVRRVVAGLALGTAPVTATVGGGRVEPDDPPRWRPGRTMQDQAADLDIHARRGRLGGISWDRSGDDYLWRMPLPGLRLRELNLSMVQDDLVLEGLGHRGLVSVPTVLRRCRPVDAELRDAVLTVRFSPVRQDEGRDERG